MNYKKRVCILGAVIFFITAIFSKGYHHFDEHFQILEFVALKLNLNTTGNMPWEYFTKMRSAVQPLIVFVLYKSLAVFGEVNPFFLTTLTRILSATLSFTAFFFLFKQFEQDVKSQKLKALVICFSFFTWFIVYDAVRFSSENWSGNFFLLGLCFACNEKGKGWKNYLISGLLFGFSFLFRFQSAFLIAGLFLWMVFIKREKMLRLAVLLAAILSVLVIGVIIDHWFYDEWFFSAWNYFDQNILQNKAANFGVFPWWYYLQQVFYNAVPIFGLVFILSFLLLFIFYPKHVFTFSLVPFLLAHFITGHKELRFLFPVLGFLPFAMTMSADAIAAKFSSSILSKVGSAFLILFWLINIPLLIIVMFRPADNLIPLYEKVYSYNSPVTIYCIDENPYHRVLDIHFYRRGNVEAVKAESLSNIQNKSGTKTLLALSNNEIPSPTEWKLVYSGLPQWMKQFNFNNWQERTKFWRLYEMKE